MKSKLSIDSSLRFFYALIFLLLIFAFMPFALSGCGSGGGGGGGGNGGGGAVPNAPSGLSAASGDGQVTLNWTASTGAESYTVLESTAGAAGPYSAVEPGIAATNYAVSSLTDGTTYYFEVEAVNAYGTGAPSNPVSATPRTKVVSYTYQAGTFPSGIAIDASGNVWVSNWGGDHNNSGGSVMELNPSTGKISCDIGVGENPQSIAIDLSGNVWTANYIEYTGGGGGISEINSDCNLAGSVPAGTSGAKNPFAIAVSGKNGGIYAANSQSSNITYFTALDYQNAVNYPVGSTPDGIAIDGISGDVWTANSGGGTVTELNSSGVQVSGSPFSVGSEPDAVAIDGNGDVWTANYGDNTVTEIKSVAVPVNLPLANPSNYTK